MFWLSCEVLYNLDQKHMKQGCYIGNTTESLLQRGVLSPFSFLLFLFVPRLLSHSRFVSICAGAEGRTFSISCLCWGRRRGPRKAYDRWTENDTRGTWVTNLCWSWEARWHCRLLLVSFRTTKAFCRFLYISSRQESPWIHWVSLLSFNILILIPSPTYYYYYLTPYLA